MIGLPTGIGLWTFVSVWKTEIYGGWRFEKAIFCHVIDVQFVNDLVDFTIDRFIVLSVLELYFRLLYFISFFHDDRCCSFCPPC